MNEFTRRIVLYTKPPDFERSRLLEFSTKEPFIILSVIEGAGTIDGNEVKKGDHFILTNGYDRFTFEGKLTIIASHITNKE